ncbi:glycosyltransferase family 4 protein [Gramella sp. AN32]|uniref:Glycosyltransferase family 4 protein n=1 Tax=Christiangramia antarctica TaxID=2058158 RepID=A0ABW5X4S8_9FLAO|nr:glycosyltransferase family 4 protein [Gramella sp. AN32]MCM4157102.1 hypothetical protein [Gramella sp. AN32]
MKILYYSTAYYAAHGGSIQSKEFYKNLSYIPGVEAAIFPKKISSGRITNSNGSWKRTLKNNRAFMPLSFYRRNQFYWNELLFKIEGFQPDVLIIQIDANFLQISRLRKLFPNLFICAQINGSVFDEIYQKIIFRKYFLKLQQESYLASDLNLFISEPSRTTIMRDSIDQNRDRIIYNGTNLEQFFPLTNKSGLKSRLNFPEDKFIVGYVGTLDRHKKMEILLKAFQMIIGEKVNIHLVILGDGPGLSELKESINAMKIQDHVSLPGWVSHEEMNQYLNCFDLAIHHYANDYMNPLKIFEYLAVGIPVIAPDIPSVRRIFRDGEDLIISKGNHKNLQLEMLTLIEDVNLRRKLANNLELRERLEKDFTWKAYARKVYEAIENQMHEG